MPATTETAMDAPVWGTTIANVAALGNAVRGVAARYAVAMLTATKDSEMQHAAVTLVAALPDAIQVETVTAPLLALVAERAGPWAADVRNGGLTLSDDFKYAAALARAMTTGRSQRSGALQVLKVVRARATDLVRLAESGASVRRDVTDQPYRLARLINPELGLRAYAHEGPNDYVRDLALLNPKAASSSGPMNTSALLEWLHGRDQPAQQIRTIAGAIKANSETAIRLERQARDAERWTLNLIEPLDVSASRQQQDARLLFAALVDAWDTAITEAERVMAAELGPAATIREGLSYNVR